MNLNERAEKAVALKASGQYNCSQAVTAALADETPLTEEQLRAVVQEWGTLKQHAVRLLEPE